MDVPEPIWVSSGGILHRSHHKRLLWLCPNKRDCFLMFTQDWVNESVNLIERLGQSSSVRRIMHAFVLRSCWSLAKINARMWHLRPYTINIQWRLTSWAFIVVVKSMLRCHWALVKILALIFSWASQRALVRSLKQSLDRLKSVIFTVKLFLLEIIRFKWS